MPDLLALPAELRNRIFRFALQEEGTIVVVPCGNNQRDWHQPALTRTSRQIRQECTDVFYHINTFDIRSEKHQVPPEGMHRALASLGEPDLALD